MSDDRREAGIALERRVRRILSQAGMSVGRYELAHVKNCWPKYAAMGDVDVVIYTTASVQVRCVLEVKKNWWPGKPEFLSQVNTFADYAVDVVGQAHPVVVIARPAVGKLEFMQSTRAMVASRKAGGSWQWQPVRGITDPWNLVRLAEDSTERVRELVSELRGLAPDLADLDEGLLQLLDDDS